MVKNKWSEFESEYIYIIEDLGRPAVFLLPTLSVSLKRELEKFITENFRGFTCFSGTSYGIYKDGFEIVHYDRCDLYEISFAEKEKMPNLLKKLAEIAKIIGEKCVYFKAGQYSCLVYPKS